MAKREYKAGSKQEKFRPEGVRSEFSAAWMKSVIGEVTLLRFTNDDIEGKKEPGPSYRIALRRTGHRWPFVITLTNMTAEELEALKDLVLIAYDAVKPIIEDRDRNADEAATAGDDSFDRIYRAVPQVVIREGQFAEDNQSLHDRLENVFKKPWVRGLRNVGARRTRDDVADDEQEGGGSEDDSKEADESS